MTRNELRRQIGDLTAQLKGRNLDRELQNWLNSEHGVGSVTYDQLAETCRQGVAEGWLCENEAGGIRYGRVFKPAADLHEFSVDVVEMSDLAGPHHSHPTGEIDLVMPVDEAALFDGHPAGWVVYEANSAHYPTVTNGCALILYLLPDGSIEFTR